MAWSIFANGNQEAVTWAKALLTEMKLPTTNSRVQFIYDWEKSEGGGGIDNPLNQGPLAGLSTSGSQYGGGAANYSSLATGIERSVDYLNMPNYAGVKSARDSSAFTYNQAESALVASPWAGGHYGGGSSWNTTPVPGTSSSASLTGIKYGIGGLLTNITTVGGDAGSAVTAASGGTISGLGGFLTDPVGTIWNAGKSDIIRATLVVVGIILLFIGVSKLFSGNNDSNPAITIVEGGKSVSKGAGKTVERGGEVASAAAA